MSLYYVQKFLYELNRDEKAQQAYLADRVGVLDGIRPHRRGGAGAGRTRHRLAVPPRRERADPHALRGVPPDRVAGLPRADAPGHRDPRPRARGRLRDDRLRGGRCAHVGARSARPGRATCWRRRESMMPLVFAGVCSHAPGIRSRYEQADPTLREGLYAAFDEMREALEANAARRDRRRRRRALRQLLHEQHAVVRDRHGRLLRRADRGHRLVEDRQGPHSGQPRAVASIHHRGHERLRRRRTPRSGVSTTGSSCRSASSRRATTFRSSR